MNILGFLATITFHVIHVTQAGNMLNLSKQWQSYCRTFSAHGDGGFAYTVM